VKQLATPRLVAILVGAVIAVAGAALLLSAVGREEQPTDLAFYIELRIERTVSPSDSETLLPTVSELRLWYEAPGKSRNEFVIQDPLLGKGEQVNVSDGRLATRYDWTTNTYRTTTLAGDSRHPMSSGPISPTWASLPVGPMGFASMDELRS
jgi:hypothetical protein